MPSRRRKTAVIAALTFAGLLSGCVTGAGAEITGVVFGFTIATALAIFPEGRSPARAFGLVLVSSIAGWIGFYFAMMLDLMDMGFGWDIFRWNILGSEPPSVALLAAGSALSAFLICGVALLLYDTDRRRLWRRSFLCALGGGVLGVVSKLAAPVLDRLSTGPPASGKYELPAFLICWLTGVGALLGMALELKSESGEPLRMVPD
jgi:hypothetical protein